MKITISKCGPAAVAVALAAALAGCGSTASSIAPSATPGQTPASSAVQAEGSGYKTGLGITAELTEADLTGKATVTAAGVLIDESGKIERCVIDVAENEAAINADGSLAMPAAYSTKWEQGDAYGLKAASGIGKEWYEQCQAFCDKVTGMTAEEVAQIPVEDGKATDADLLAGCTIRISPFVTAVLKACDNAKALGASSQDTLSLGTVSTPSGTDATDDADGKAEVATTFVLLTKNADSRVSSAIMDQIVPYFTTDTAGSLTAQEGSVTTKLEKGADYGLASASGIGKEWYEQSEGFCAYLKGKTAGEIRAVPSNGTDADLAAVCTIDWTDMLQAAVKAAETE